MDAWLKMNLTWKPLKHDLHACFHVLTVQMLPNQLEEKSFKAGD